jgi:hypothetical protein
LAISSLIDILVTRLILDSTGDRCGIFIGDPLAFLVAWKSIFNL